MSEKEKMINEEIYDSGDTELVNDRRNAWKMTRMYNQTTEDEKERRILMLKSLLGTTGQNISMEPNIRFDYGYNKHVGENFYANFDCTILDVSEVHIGDNCMLAPGVQIYTAAHPIDPEERISGVEFAKKVTIGDNVVVASGAVVVKDVPDNVIVGGNPARIIRKID